MPFAATWVDLETVVPSEVTRKDTHSPCKWSVVPSEVTQKGTHTPCKWAVVPSEVTRKDTQPLHVGSKKKWHG